MSLDTFLTKISGFIDEKIKQMEIKTTKQVDNPFMGEVNASIFAGADFSKFQNVIKDNMSSKNDDSIFFQNIDEFGAQKVFDYFDKNSDGTISEDEINELSSVDGDEKTISGYDLNYALNDIAMQELLDSFDNQVASGKIDPVASNNEAFNNYTSNIGGSNYKDYGSQTHNGSTISSEQQYNSKEQLDKIQNEEIPQLEQKKKEVIQKAQEEVDLKNEQIQTLTEENKETLGTLGDELTQKQTEIQEIDTTISQTEAEISNLQSSIRTSESSLANLKSELGNLDTNTDDENINASNKQRKSDIESQIKNAEDKIAQEKEKIEEFEAIIKNQEELKTQKQEELTQVQDKISILNPQLAEQISQIQEDIAKIEENKDKEVAEIDAQIETKHVEAKKIQSEIGEKTGITSSQTGSKTVQEALKLAQQELAKGVYEFTGNNDNPEIDKYRNGAANGQPWCASFVSWIYGAGQNSDNAATFGYDASVSGIRSKAQKAGFYAEKGTYTPQAGDLMIQKNNASHVGMVVSVDPDGTIHTIEGNCSDKVKERTYKPGSSGYNSISGWVKMTDWLNN